MRKFLIIGALALSACGASGPSDYAMSVGDAEAKLLAAEFERGIVPGSSRLKPDIKRNGEGEIEWHVLDDSENGHGWWCPILVEKAGDDGSKVRIVNQCKGMFAKNNRHLDELVDATLTGREINRDALK